MYIALIKKVEINNHFKEIFLTKKLSEFLAINQAQSSEEDFEKWSAHVFILERKKNIIFTHKETLYTFILHGLVKSDLKSLPKRMLDELTIQLEADNVNTENALKYFNITASTKINLLRTDNDQKTLGWIRDLIQIINAVIERDNQNKIINSTSYVHHAINKFPIGKRNYKSSIKILLEKMN